MKREQNLLTSGSCHASCNTGNEQEKLYANRLLYRRSIGQKGVFCKEKRCQNSQVVKPVAPSSMSVNALRGDGLPVLSEYQSTVSVDISSSFG